MTLADILARTRHVLLDFDGPVCAIYGGTSDRAVADHLRGIIAGRFDLPEPVATTSDPLAVLRHCANIAPDLLYRLEAEFTAEEVCAVASATPTPGIRQAMASLVDAGHTITVVSNNSAQAVNAYLAGAELAGLVVGVVGRVPGRPELMKPHPHLLHVAITDRATSPAQCVMVGDSTTDVEAAQAAGTASIAYANRPSKRLRFEKLQPGAIIESMHELAAAVS